MRAEAKRISVTVEQVVEGALAQELHTLYLASFGHLERRAAARHVLHEDEFAEEMADRRIDKYVAWDDHGQAVGLCTLTGDLDAVPWISPAYYAERYPDHYARNAVFYLGFALVHPSLRGYSVLRELAAEFVPILLDKEAVLAWDICAYNESRHLNRLFASILHRAASATVEEIDRQRYLACVFHAARGSDR